jgi:hypothetical protein
MAGKRRLAPEQGRAGMLGRSPALPPGSREWRWNDLIRKRTTQFPDQTLI